MIYPTTLTGSIVFFLARIIQVYNFLILARVLASWVVRDPSNQIYHFLYSITEPMLGRIRRVLPMMGLDLSPIIAYFILNLVAKMLFSII
ncbi:MAG TPA: YggT family protein [Candidatus Cloacimonas sp.]|nr:YggT family protein [Candidatus Cloacimonas sp.]